MNWDAIGAIGEIVGAFAVVVSLLFVGWQLYQNTDALKTSTSQSHLDSFFAIASTVFKDPEFAELYNKGLFEPETLSDVDRIRFYGFCTSTFRYYETSYIQFRKGKLDAELWDTLETQLASISSTRGVQQWWKTRANWFSKDFQQLFETQRGKDPNPESLYSDPNSIT